MGLIGAKSRLILMCTIRRRGVLDKILSVNRARVCDRHNRARRERCFGELRLLWHEMVTEGDRKVGW